MKIRVQRPPSWEEKKINKEKKSVVGRTRHGDFASVGGEKWRE